MIKYIVEFLGTFLFLSVFVSTGQPILIALALLVCMLLGNSVSGAHFNPAVSLMFFAKGALTPIDAAMYIAVQFLGGLAALVVFRVLS